MTIGILQLLQTLGQIATDPRIENDPPIKARLLYRGENGEVIREELADFGYSSGLRAELTVEMNSAKEEKR